jgi:hypothetical protein
LPSGSAFRAEYRSGPWRVGGFVGRLPSMSVQEDISPDGGRQYQLSNPVKVGTERLVVVTAGQETPLLAGRDYALDTLTGRLVLAAPLSPFGPDFVPQRLRVTYVPEGSQSREAGFGVNVAYSDGPLTVEGAAANVGHRLNFGVRAAYRTAPFTLIASYQTSSQQANQPQSTRASLEATYQDGPWSGVVNLSAEPNSADLNIQGTAEANYRTSQFGVRLRHRLLPEGQRTSLTADRALTPQVSVGAGLEVAWPSLGDAQQTPSQNSIGLGAVALARVSSGPVQIELQHVQPITGSTLPVTQLNASYALTSQTALKARLQRTWDESGRLIGEVGVEQRLGNTNLNVTYQLPGASGQSSRARFGVVAPLTLTDQLTANLSATLSRELDSGVNTASTSVALRQVQEGLVGTFGIDAVRSWGSATPQTQFTVRGGLTAQVQDHTFSVDGRAQWSPQLQTQFNVSHAWHSSRVWLVQSHRLNMGLGSGASVTSADLPGLEGEIAADVQLFSSGLADINVTPTSAQLAVPSRLLRLQPSLAYRFPFSPGAAFTLQAGLGLTVPLAERLEVGLSGYALWQPQPERFGATYSLDLRYLVRDGVRLVAGYTFGVGNSVEALTTGARPGAFLRAELFGGRP